MTFAHLGVLPPAQGGLASALNNTARQIGLAVGIAVLGALLEAVAAQGGDPFAEDGSGELLRDLRLVAVAARRAGRRRARAPRDPCSSGQSAPW